MTRRWSEDWRSDWVSDDPIRDFPEYDAALREFDPSLDAKERWRAYMRAWRSVMCLSPPERHEWTWFKAANGRRIGLVN